MWKNPRRPSRLRRRQPVDALLQEALALYPDHLVLRWIEAILALDRGDLERAREPLERLAAIDADRFFDPRLSYEKTLFRHLANEALALCHFRAGRFRQAAHHYRMAATTSPAARPGRSRSSDASVSAAANGPHVSAVKSVGTRVW